MREVVVQQKATLNLTLLYIVHKLLVFFSAQGGGDQSLCFAPSKECGTVDARQPANLAAYRADFGKSTAVRSPAAIENIVAEDGFLKMVEKLFRHLSFFGLI